MHIIVLGGAGAMGRVTVRTLTEYEDVDQITIADYNEERAREGEETAARVGEIDGPEEDGEADGAGHPNQALGIRRSANEESGNHFT